MTHRQKGSALPVVAVIVTGIGLAFAAANYFSTEQAATGREVRAKAQLEAMADQLVVFAKTQKRLPCPASGTATGATAGFADPDGGTPCGSQTEGVVPWKTLGLPGGLDPWQRRISYRVAPGAEGSDALAPPTMGGLTVNKDSGAETGVAFVLFSHGEPGRGAYLDTGSRTPPPGDNENDDERRNLDNNTEFFALTRSDAAVDDEDRFDHIFALRLLSEVASDADPEEECIPKSPFSSGLSATGEDGEITLKGSITLNDLPAQLTAVKLSGNKSSPYAASATRGKTLILPSAPENNSNEHVTINSDTTLSDDANYLSLNVKDTLTINSGGALVLNVSGALSVESGTITVSGDTRIYAGSMSLPASGTIHVSSGTLTVITYGTLEINGNITRGSGGHVLFLTDGDMNLRGNGNKDAYFYATGDAKISGTGEVNGSVVANNVEVSGNATFTYDSDAPPNLSDDCP